MSTNYYKIQGHGKKSIRGNRYKRYTIDRYNQLDGKMVFAENVAWQGVERALWHYSTNAEAEADLLRIIAEDESRGYSVEVL